MNASIACAGDGATRLLKLSGELRHDNAGALEDLIEQWFDHGDGAVNEVIIDLNDLTFMDSTVIGLLAAITRGLAEIDAGKPLVFSSGSEINALLRSLRLDEAMNLIDQPAQTPAISLSDCQDSESHEQVSGPSILRAHELLMGMSEENREAFEPVVELLRANLRH